MIIAISSEVFVMKHIADKIWRDKKLVFIDTSSNGQAWDRSWLENQISAITQEYWEINRYSIEWKTISDFKLDLWEYDVIHIWWGNTAYLLFHVLQTWFDSYLREIQDSKIIVGSSAGAKILWEKIGHVQALDDFTAADLNDFNGLGFFNFDIWAHFWKEKYREKYNDVLDIAYETSQSWIYISDGSYIIKDTWWVNIYNIKS